MWMPHVLRYIRINFNFVVAVGLREEREGHPESRPVWVSGARIGHGASTLKSHRIYCGDIELKMSSHCTATAFQCRAKHGERTER